MDLSDEKNAPTHIEAIIIADRRECRFISDHTVAVSSIIFIGIRILEKLLNPMIAPKRIENGAAVRIILGISVFCENNLLLEMLIDIISIVSIICGMAVYKFLEIPCCKPGESSRRA